MFSSESPEAGTDPDPHAGDLYTFAHCATEEAMREAQSLLRNPATNRESLSSSSSPPFSTPSGQAPPPPSSPSLGIAMVMVNLGGDQDTAMNVTVSTVGGSSVRFPGFGASAALVPRLEYHLAPPDGSVGIGSKRVALNGAVLEYVKGSGELPPMKPVVVTDPTQPLLI